MAKSSCGQCAANGPGNSTHLRIDARSPANVNVPLYRLRPVTQYTAEVYLLGPTDDAALTGTEDATLVCAANFTTLATGYSYFDDGALATVTGRPSYQTMMVDLVFASEDFKGVVMLDNAGYVVWCVHSSLARKWRRG